MTAPAGGRSAFAAALALLTGRALTVGELEERLQRRGFEAGSVVETIGRLVELGHLDDRRTAAAWAESAVRLRGLGPQRLRVALDRRRLPPEIVEETLDGLFGAGEEARLAAAALGKWERARGSAEDDRSRKAAYAHLRRRGFSGAASRAALFKHPQIE